MTLHGIDISHWQSGLQLAKTDAQFVIIKATEGTGYVDPACNGFYSQAKKAGLKRGLYHFYQGDPVHEADHFIRNISGWLGDAMLVLDFETHTYDSGGAKTWLDRVTAKTGIRPVIYMSQSVAASGSWGYVAKEYALWVARYNDVIGYTGPWSSVAMWQYTNAHHTGGYAVDGDHFYGDRDAWDAYATGGTPDHTNGNDNDDSGGSNTMANEVWNEDLTLWVPSTSNLEDKSGDTMRAGQQMNQARGFAEATYENTRQVKQALRALAKDPSLAAATETSMLDKLSDD